MKPAPRRPRSWSLAPTRYVVHRSRADAHWAKRTARMEARNGRRMQQARWVACSATTASRPSSVPVPYSPDRGTSRWAQHGVQAVQAASLQGCQTPFNRSVVPAAPLSQTQCSPLSQNTDDQLQRQGFDWEPHSPNQAATTTTQQQHCCSFEMIRASFQQDWASRGCFRYTWTTGIHSRGVRSKDY